MQSLHQFFQRSSDAISNPGASVDNFIASLEQPVKSAIDTPMTQPVQEGDVFNTGAGAFRVTEVKTDQPKPEEQKQVFPDDAAEEKYTAPTGSKATTAQGMTIESMLKVKSMLTAQLAALLAKQGITNYQAYMPEDWQLDMLAEAYAPYADTISGMLPPWVMIVIVESMITGGILIRAFNDRNTAIRSQQAIRTGAPATVVAQAVAANGAQKQRTNFTIKKDGSYKYDRNGEYVKQDDPKERVDFSNMDELREVVEKNGWDAVRKAYDLPEDWAQTRGISFD